MTIRYGPYDLPPPTVPPPDLPPPDLPPPDVPPPPAAPGLAGRGPSLIGTLLCVLGLGMALIGLFALPLQRYGPDEEPPLREVGYLQVHALVTDQRYGPDYDFASPFAQLWWTTGLLFAVSALVVLTGGVCVSRDLRFLRPFGAVTALVAGGSGVCLWFALKHTHDFRSEFYSSPGASMFHDTGLGIWLAFAGLAALTIGGLLTVLLNLRPARP